MYNTIKESEQDIDFGSGGALILPPQKDVAGKVRSLAIGAGKNHNIYVVDRTNMGKFNPHNNSAVYQEIDGALEGGIWGMPAYHYGAVYFGPVGNHLLKFQLSKAKLSTTPVSHSATSFVYPGTTPSISANGPRNGVVWTIEHSDPDDVLHAYDAANLKKELYHSNQAPQGRDHIGTASHFGTPMIVNGKVYVGTANALLVFGLLE